MLYRASTCPTGIFWLNLSEFTTYRGRAPPAPRNYTLRSILIGAPRADYLSVHGMTTDGEFINTFEDEIRQRGAMDTIISDRAQAEVSNRVKTILRNLYIKDWQSEPHHQNQNISERFIQELKKYANWIRNTSGAPPQAIFLILKYVCFIFNRTARKNLSWRHLAKP
ncbi:hypothetical protein QTG54_014959 [Skeletonema marinoi]|uniref:Integrase catalytic domain-containing protein n=1 Tax=Skeletonema marinoi TaxID=267567 RepID=A0AAD8XVW2_9STRA|nr:hypothetical protein QTG54_014959 [Skeletonema marinoi]